MKTMDDFKGTKGDYRIFGVDQTRVASGDSTIIHDGAETQLEYEEAKANAKLFANSKKALEALMRAYDWNESVAKLAEEGRLDTDSLARNTVLIQSIINEAIENSL